MRRRRGCGQEDHKGGENAHGDDDDGDDARTTSNLVGHASSGPGRRDDGRRLSQVVAPWSALLNMALVATMLTTPCEGVRSARALLDGAHATYQETGPNGTSQRR